MPEGSLRESPASEADRLHRDLASVSLFASVVVLFVVTLVGGEGDVKREREELEAARSRVSRLLDGDENGALGWRVDQLQDLSPPIEQNLRVLVGESRETASSLSLVGELAGQRMHGLPVTLQELLADGRDLEVLRDTYGSLYWSDFRKLTNGHPGLSSEQRQRTAPADVFFDILAQEGLVGALQIPREGPEPMGHRLGSALDSVTARRRQCEPAATALERLIEWDPRVTECGVGMSTDLARECLDALVEIERALGKRVYVSDDLFVERAAELGSMAEERERQLAGGLTIEVHGVDVAVPVAVGRWIVRVGVPLYAVVWLLTVVRLRRLRRKCASEGGTSESETNHWWIRASSEWLLEPASLLHVGLASAVVGMAIWIQLG